MDLAVHHIGIVVDDIDRAKEVYEKAFGLKIKGRYLVDEFNVEGGTFVLKLPGQS